MSKSKVSPNHAAPTEGDSGPLPPASDTPPQRPVDPYAASLPNAHSGNQMSPAVPLVGILLLVLAVILWGAFNR